MGITFKSIPERVDSVRLERNKNAIKTFIWKFPIEFQTRTKWPLASKTRVTRIAEYRRPIAIWYCFVLIEMSLSRCFFFIFALNELNSRNISVRWSSSRTRKPAKTYPVAHSTCWWSSTRDLCTLRNFLRKELNYNNTRKVCFKNCFRLQRFRNYFSKNHAWYLPGTQQLIFVEKK